MLCFLLIYSEQFYKLIQNIKTSDYYVFSSCFSHFIVKNDIQKLFETKNVCIGKTKRKETKIFNFRSFHQRFT